MSARRLLPLVLLNVIVSAAVVFGILYWWENRSDAEPEPEAVVIAPTAAATQAAQPAQPAVLEEEAEPAEEAPTHTVQAGDTLGSISSQFDVSMDDIMTANGINDPNFLQIGQVLIIPVGGLAAETETPVDELSPAGESAAGEPPTPIPTELPTSGEVIIEIAEVAGAGEVEQEFVSIKNSGNIPIALLGWRLNDEDGRTYTFGQVTLFGDGAAINLHSGRGIEGPADLYWGFDEAIWRPGETVTLVDGEGSVRATFVVESS